MISSFTNPVQGMTPTKPASKSLNFLAETQNCNFVVQLFPNKKQTEPKHEKFLAPFGRDQMEPNKKKQKTCSRLKVGVVGYGELGRYLTHAILKDPKASDLLELGFIWNRYDVDGWNWIEWM